MDLKKGCKNAQESFHFGSSGAVLSYVQEVASALDGLRDSDFSLWYRQLAEALGMDALQKEDKASAQPLTWYELASRVRVRKDLLAALITQERGNANSLVAAAVLIAARISPLGHFHGVGVVLHQVCTQLVKFLEDTASSTGLFHGYNDEYYVNAFGPTLRAVRESLSYEYGEPLKLIAALCRLMILPVHED